MRDPLDQELDDLRAESKYLRAALDEADALIANLAGIQLMSAWPEGRSKEKAEDNWRRRCFWRHVEPPKMATEPLKSQD